jgi:hypothetical protein
MREQFLDDRMLFSSILSSNIIKKLEIRSECETYKLRGSYDTFYPAQFTFTLSLRTAVRRKIMINSKLDKEMVAL